MADPSCDDREPRDLHGAPSVQGAAHKAADELNDAPAGPDDRPSDPSREGDRPSFSGAGDERTSDVPERTSHPGLGVPRKPRRRSERDDLEQRLAAIAEDVRVKAEEAERQRREQTTLEAKVYVEGVKPVESHAPDKIEGAKVLLAPGLDPRHDPTLIGRRNGHDEWEFGVVGDAPDGNQTRPGAPGESLPGERRGGRRIVAGVLGGAVAAALLVLVLQSRRTSLDGESVRGLAAPARPREDAPAPVARVEVPAPVTGAIEMPMPGAPEEPVEAGMQPGASAWKAAPRRAAPKESGAKVARPEAGRSRTGTGPIGKDPEY